MPIDNTDKILLGLSLFGVLLSFTAVVVRFRSKMDDANTKKIPQFRECCDG